MNNIRIVCPSTNLDKAARIKQLEDEIRKWIYSKPLRRLLSSYGIQLPYSKIGIRTIVDWLNNFTQIWDYRTIQANHGERWLLSDDSSVKGKEDIIFQSAAEFGFLKTRDPLLIPDYILPLGGARLSNLERPRLARELVDNLKLTHKNIIALSGTRQIDNIEKENLQNYAPYAKTEFEALTSGLKKAFGISSFHQELTNRKSSSLIKFSDKYCDNKLFSLEAFSSDSSRRANSRDTFESFLNCFNPQKDSNILLITSSTYTTSQLLGFIDLAIDYDIYVDCIGTNIRSDQIGSVKFLQEIKSIVDQLKRLCSLFF